MEKNTKELAVEAGKNMKAEKYEKNIKNYEKWKKNMKKAHEKLWKNYVSYEKIEWRRDSEVLKLLLKTMKLWKRNYEKNHEKRKKKSNLNPFIFRAHVFKIREDLNT